MIGRYAPSPSGRLHVGNLRTAMLAWLSAHHHGGELRLRIDDLDPNVCTPEHEGTQLDDLAAMGITFAGPMLRQSARSAWYSGAIDELGQKGLLYECFCSRREVREAAQAPHVHLPEGAYPGTCSDLTDSERAERSQHRPAALRVRSGHPTIDFTDRHYGPQSEFVDDFVIQRNDGVASYNLATVLDDADQGVTEVVRGADLLQGTARHIWLRTALGLDQVEHAHVPLMIDEEGERLAKRGGGVNLAELEEIGFAPDQIRRALAVGIGLWPAADPTIPAMEDLLERFNPETLPTTDTVWTIP